MKSAYELAMERLNGDDPEGAVPLSREHKLELERIDAQFRAKIAEREVFLQSKLREARQSGDPTAVAQLERQLRDERLGFQEDCEAAKDKVRAAAREQA